MYGRNYMHPKLIFAMQTMTRYHFCYLKVSVNTMKMKFKILTKFKIVICLVHIFLNSFIFI